MTIKHSRERSKKEKKQGSQSTAIHTSEEKQEITAPSNGASPSQVQIEEPSNGETKSRSLEIVKRASDLYDAFVKAKFSRDSYIELGESVKQGKDFKAVHPAVQHLIMKIAKQIHDL